MIRVSARVKPGSKEDNVTRVSERDYIIRVKAPARDGRANKKAIELLSEYFGKPKSCVSIAIGAGSKNKVIDIK